MCYRGWLHPLLFVVYINELRDNVVHVVIKFADDTRTGAVVKSQEGYLYLQRDLDQLQI